MTTDTLIVVPARIGSTRLPGKALADIAGAPMIVRVLQRLSSIRHVPVLVATDDTRIADVVAAAGGLATLTSPDCATGLDRIAEAVQGRPESIILNVQGDEPFICPDEVLRLRQLMKASPDIRMATLAAGIVDRDDWTNPSVVKVVTDQRDNALLFSRAPILFSSGPPSALARHHVGVYAYRQPTLEMLHAAGPAALEQTERLEQLRALALGIPIRVLETRTRPLGVDTLEDLSRARERWVREKHQHGVESERQRAGR